ncbi:MAG TPA: amidohydrolase family protein [Gemmatimonadaceae bacterium]
MRARFMTAAVLALSAFAGAAAAQTIAITGGKVFPVSGPPIENGTVLIRDGKIVAVGANVAIPSDAQRIDASGKWVTPGLVNPATELGLAEVGFGGDANESNAQSDEGLSPAFRVWDGLNPRSPYIVATREDGITSNLSVPVGGLIAGQAAFIDLVDGPRDSLLVKAPAAMVGQIDNDENAKAGARGELLTKLRSLLDDAKYYAGHRSDFDRAQSREMSVGRAGLEAMVPVVEGRVPLLLEAERASDIGAALDLAKEYGIKLIIGGGSEAWMIADRIAAAKVPVMVGAMNNIPLTFTTLGARQENAALLRKAGVEVALIGNAGGGDEELFNARNIRYEAGNAVAYGMSWSDALRAVTLTPAEMFGVADRVGSLAPGRVANVVVWSGDPFEFATRPTQVIVHGKVQHDTSRQDLLTERYKTLPPEYEGNR